MLRKPKTKPISVLNSIQTALLISIIVLVSSISYTTFIYSGSLSVYVPFIIIVTIICSIVSIIITTSFSSNPLSIAYVQDTGLPVYMLIVIAALHGITNASPSVLFSTAFFTIGFSTLLTGVCFYLLGAFKQSQIIRYIPFPIVAGFFAGTGWFIFTLSLNMVLDFNLGLNNFLQVFHYSVFIKWLPSFLYALIILFVCEKYKNSLSLPIILLAGFIAFYLWQYFFQLNGVLSQDSSTHFGDVIGSASIFLKTFSLREIDWIFILSHSFEITIIILVSLFAFLFNLSAISLEMGAEFDMDKELKITGLINILISGVGSIASYATNLETIINYRMGNATRIVGYLIALFCTLIFFVFPAFLTYYPKPIIVGFLMYLGLSITKSWSYDLRDSMVFSDKLLLLLMFFSTILYGFVIGMVVGLIAATILFTIKYSRLSIIKYELDGTNMLSTLQRDEKEEEVLVFYGTQLHYFKLQNYLFFGTLNVLRKTIYKRINNLKNPLRYVILDFKSVVGLDSSISFAFMFLKNFAIKNDFKIIFTEMDVSVQEQLFKTKVFMPKDEIFIIMKHYESAVEWCENQIIRSYITTEKKEYPIYDYFLNQFQDAQKARSLTHYFTPVVIEKNTLLFKKGVHGEDILYLEKGKLLISFGLTDRAEEVLRTIGVGNFVGEMAVYTNFTRTATVTAEEDCLLYQLSYANLKSMRDKEPELAMDFHKLMIKILSNKLEFANKKLMNLLK